MANDSYQVQYSLKIKTDTYLKISTSQSRDIPDSDKCLVKAGSEYPIGSWANASNGHLRVSFGLNKEGEQITFTGPGGRPRNTWIVFKQHCEVIKNGRPINPPATPSTAGAVFALTLKPTGQRDDYGCLTFTLSWTKNGDPVDQMTVLSGAPNTDIVYPTEDFSGSLRPLPEGVYNLGPVERGWFGEAIGNIAVELLVQPAYKVNNRSAFFIHEDANRAMGAPGSAGCVSPYTATDMERVASWLNARSRPQYLVADYGLGFLKKQGYRG